MRFASAFTLEVRQAVGHPLRRYDPSTHNAPPIAKLRWNHLRISPDYKEFTMPILLWLLGVPISVVLLLMLFGVF